VETNCFILIFFLFPAHIFPRDNPPLNFFSLFYFATGERLLSVKLKFDESECQVKVGNFADLTRIVPIQFTKFQNTAFGIQVNKAIVSEDTFYDLVVTGAELIVVSLSLPFSDYKYIEQLEEYAHIAGLDEGLQLPSSFDIPEESMIPTDVHREFEARLEVFDLTETTECIMREFIGPILIGAIRLLGAVSGIKIKSEHKIEGTRGRGPVDYDILFHLFHIVVCEAKNGKDVVDGIPQNGAQLVASREVFQNIQSKKRKRENDNELREELDKLPSFGIVSTGRSWVFICYHKNSCGDWKLERSLETHLPLSARPEERVGLMEGITSLLKIVAGIMLAQKVAVEEFEKSFDPKRARTNT
jgi:hypothetical protein